MIRGLINRMLRYIANHASGWENAAGWWRDSMNAHIMSRSDWLPSGESWGSVMRLRGLSSPGNGAGGDTYYICVSSTQHFYIGVQINRSTTITWKKVI